MNNQQETELNLRLNPTERENESYLTLC